MSNRRSTLIGYYDRPDQPREQPTYDPPHDGPCIVCFRPLTPDTVRTVSVLAENGVRCYFYRLHRACDAGLSDTDRMALDASVMDSDNA